MNIIKKNANILFKKEIKTPKNKQKLIKYYFPINNIIILFTCFNIEIHLKKT